MKKYLIVGDPGQSQDPFSLQIYRANPVLVNGTPQLETSDRVLVKDDLVMQYRIMNKRYQEVCRFIRDLMDREDMKDQTMFVFDCTGIGRAVKDQFQEWGVKTMVPISYTNGFKTNYVYRDLQDERFSTTKGYRSLDFKVLDQINVPKSDLVEAARIALEQHQVRVNRNVPYVSDFDLQMRSFTGKMNANGYTSFNNSDDEIHDDFVNCFMMRSWYRSNFREQIISIERNADKHEEIADYGIYGGL